MDPEIDDEQLATLVQGAIDATATAYTEDADVDVEDRVRDELAERGLDVSDDEWLSELAHNIRSGHHVVVSTEPPDPAL